MSLPHRISAGAIVFRENRVLLVRYPSSKGGSYVVAPGGGIDETEELPEAAVREAWEETGVVVSPVRPLAVENLVGGRSRACKFWFLCEWVSGEAQVTEGALAEGISQVRWFTREQLDREQVFPWFLKEHAWDELVSPDFAIAFRNLRRMEFE